MKAYYAGVLYGVVFVFIFILFSSALLAMLLKFTSMTEDSIKLTSMIVSYVLLFIGGMLSGLKVKQKGILVGLSTGVLFTLIVFLVKYLGYDSLFNLRQIVAHIGYIAAATMGGILGVNKASNDFS